MKNKILMIIGAAALMAMLAGCASSGPLVEKGVDDGKTYNAGGVLETFTVTNNGLNLQMIKLDSIADFPMGPPDSEKKSFLKRTNDLLVHEVYIGSFSMSKLEVTVDQYVKFLNSGGKDAYYHSFMKNVPFCGIISNGPGKYSIAQGRGRYPVVYVSWNDAKAYCDWLSSVTGQKWRLPTEAEWEYAAVGNSGHRIWPWGDTFQADKCNSGLDYAEGGKDGYAFIAPPGKYPEGKSPLGFLDMAGNVFEWCADWYNKGYKTSGKVRNPQGAYTGNYKTLRGGSFYGPDGLLRSSVRISEVPSCDSGVTYGFRPVRQE